jgi:hypothetical protein
MSVAGYKLLVNGGAYSDHEIDVGNVLTYDITGLSPGTSYDVQVAAYDTYGNLSAYSAVETETTTAFLPTNVSGLQLWLKADAIVGLNDNDPVTDWQDSSSANNDAASGGGTGLNPPTYKTNILNGLPAVRFDAVNDGMITPLVLSAAPYSIFLVYACATAVSGSRRMIQGSNNWLIGPFSAKHDMYDGGFRTAAPAVYVRLCNRDSRCVKYGFLRRWHIERNKGERRNASRHTWAELCRAVRRTGKFGPS